MPNLESIAREIEDNLKPWTGMCSPNYENLARWHAKEVLKARIDEAYIFGGKDREEMLRKQLKSLEVEK